MISLVRGSADPLARSQETTSCRIRAGSGATVVDRIPNEFIESSLCDRSVMKPSSSVLLSLLLLLFLYLHASRSMNSNLQKKRERRREREKEGGREREAPWGVSLDEWRCSSRNIGLESFDRENGRHRSSMNPPILGQTVGKRVVIVI